MTKVLLAGYWHKDKEVRKLLKGKGLELTEHLKHCDWLLINGWRPNVSALTVGVPEANYKGYLDHSIDVDNFEEDDRENVAFARRALLSGKNVAAFSSAGLCVHVSLGGNIYHDTDRLANAPEKTVANVYQIKSCSTNKPVANGRLISSQMFCAPTQFEDARPLAYSFLSDKRYMVSNQGYVTCSNPPPNSVDRKMDWQRDIESVLWYGLGPSKTGKALCCTFEPSQGTINFITDVINNEKV